MSFPFRLPLLLDGATGTNLINAGMTVGTCTEKFILENPDILVNLQRDFVSAGSDCILAPTFGANRAKLSDYDLQMNVSDINCELVSISRSAVNNSVLIGGDMSPTGFFIEPFGEISFSEILDIYKEQAAALKNSGVNFILCETMMSLWECRAALIAAKETELPVFVTVTIDDHGRTVSGSDVLSCLITLQAMGADAFGINCSQGPDAMLPFISLLRQHAKIPIIAKPNAGIPNPQSPSGYDLSPKEMASKIGLLLDAGASIVGGCCGTTPEHIKELRAVVDSFRTPAAEPVEEDIVIAANETDTFFISEIAEISPPISCEIDMSDALIDIADEGYDIILINIATPDDAYHFGLNAHMAKLPVMFNAADAESLDNALKFYQGRALVDSKCDIDEESVRKIAEKYGAVIY